MREPPSSALGGRVAVAPSAPGDCATEVPPSAPVPEQEEEEEDEPRPPTGVSGLTPGKK